MQLDLAFPKCGLPLCVFNITGNLKNFVHISTILELSNKTEILHEIISPAILCSTKKADHILKISGLGDFFG